MTEGLAVSSLSVRARGAELLRDVDLRISPGEFVAIVGPNGAGKSTLLKALCGLLPSAARELSVDGRDLNAMSGRERAGLLAWLPQRDAGVEPVRAIDRVAAARFRFQEGRARSLEAARRALEAFGVEPLAERTMDTLSGGEAQRVALAALAAQEAAWWLLDEPAHHLDPGRQVEVYQGLGARWRGEHGEAQSMIAVTHDVNLLGHAVAEGWAERLSVVGLARGELRFKVPLSSPSLPEQLSALFATRIEAVDLKGRRHFVVLGGDL